MLWGSDKIYFEISIIGLYGYFTEFGRYIICTYILWLVTSFMGVDGYFIEVGRYMMGCI